MCAACISSINQHCYEGERGMLIKQSKIAESVPILLAKILVMIQCTGGIWYITMSPLGTRTEYMAERTGEYPH